MSELKAETIYLQHESGENYAVEFYLKSEADKVIAEKDKEVADAGMENRKLQDELTKLKAQMPEYKQFIEDEDFKKKLVDEYAGYVYDWKGRHYIATPYLNIFIKGILRALWLYRATTAKHLVTAYENYDYLDCQEMTIKQENARTWMTCKLRTAEEWVKVWKNVERKCRAKAEEYK